MQKPFLIIAALFGILSVAIGAFGAHAIRAAVSPDAYEIYETGVRYQFYHTLALLAVGVLLTWFPGRLLSLAGIFFIVGIVLFSGSLYLITALKSADRVISPAVGILTPVGGLFFIAGWVMLFVAFLGRKPV
jgi:uncharacterized membrane protein YgdD (TMEM256/DUF423 family)